LDDFENDFSSLTVHINLFLWNYWYCMVRWWLYSDRQN